MTNRLASLWLIVISTPYDDYPIQICDSEPQALKSARDCIDTAKSVVRNMCDMMNHIAEFVDPNTISVVYYRNGIPVQRRVVHIFP